MCNVLIIWKISTEKNFGKSKKKFSKKFSRIFFFFQLFFRIFEFFSIFFTNFFQIFFGCSFFFLFRRKVVFYQQLAFTAAYGGLCEASGGRLATLAYIPPTLASLASTPTAHYARPPARNSKKNFVEEKIWSRKFFKKKKIRENFFEIFFFSIFHNFFP